MMGMAGSENVQVRHAAEGAAGASGGVLWTPRTCVHCTAQTDHAGGGKLCSAAAPSLQRLIDGWPRGTLPTQEALLLRLLTAAGRGPEEAGRDCQRGVQEQPAPLRPVLHPGAGEAGAQARGVGLAANGGLANLDRLRGRVTVQEHALRLRTKVSPQRNTESVWAERRRRSLRRRMSPSSLRRSTAASTLWCVGLGCLQQGCSRAAGCRARCVQQVFVCLNGISWLSFVHSVAGETAAAGCCSTSRPTRPAPSPSQVFDPLDGSSNIDCGVSGAPQRWAISATLSSGPQLHLSVPCVWHAACSPPIPPPCPSLSAVGTIFGIYKAKDPQAELAGNFTLDDVLRVRCVWGCNPPNGSTATAALSCVCSCLVA